MKRKAFALIELLVVVAIMGILASLLLPALARAKAQAKRTSCLCRIKQLGLGLLMYALENDDSLPFGERDAGEAIRTRSPNVWHRQIFPYLDSRAVYECPAASGKPHPYLNGPFDYSANAHVVRPDRPTPTTSLGDASLYALVHDASREVANFQWDASDFLVAIGAEPSSESMRQALRRHGGGMLTVYVDGHCTWVKTEASGSAEITARLGQLGDSVEGTPLWPTPASGAKAFLRKYSNGSASSGF